MILISLAVTRWLLDWIWIFLVVLPGFASEQNIKDLNKLISLGKDALARGQYADALNHYHAAIGLDSSNYQSLYMRATIYLALRKPNAALSDFNQVVSLKPDFSAGRVQRGNVLFKMGALDKAQSDYEHAIKEDPSNTEVIEKIQSIAVLKETMKNAENFFHSKNVAAAEKLFTKVIEACHWYAEAYEMRAKCHMKSGESQKAISDYQSVSKLVPNSIETYSITSHLYYSIGNVEESLNQVRECLKLDPDHKECFAHYKKVKKLAKMRESLSKSVKEEKWTDCLEEATRILKYEPNVESIQIDVYKHTCKCNLNAGHIGEAITHCTEVLQYGDPNDLDALINRAEAYLSNEQYDEAISDYQTAVNAHEDSKQAREGLQRAQKLKKQQGRRDYYKILDVGRRASKQEILKAYRKLARKWHPDNFQNESDKKQAEKKFLDIAAAKEVLSDPEKRAQFDNGEDPLDAERQQGGFQNPFHGFPFGGNDGPFSFQFHFG